MRSFSRILTCAGAAALLSCAPLAAEEAPELQNALPSEAAGVSVSEVSASAKKEISKDDIMRLSQAFGNFIGKNLSNPGINFDLESLILGIRDGAAGKPSPMSEAEYEETLALLQEKAIQELSADNLKKADAFLVENVKGEKVVELVAGKLQYEVLEEGTGSAVAEHATPQLHYTGKFIDGTVFGSSEGMESPIAIPLDQTIPGFSKGLLGMKEGERRRIYVHPDLAYGTTGQLPPNELLIFDIELVKADSPQPSLSDEMALSELLDEEIELSAEIEAALDGAEGEGMQIVVEDTAAPAMDAEQAQVSSTQVLEPAEHAATPESAEHANTTEVIQPVVEETTAAAL